jgi:hypothetical protein
MMIARPTTKSLAATDSSAPNLCPSQMTAMRDALQSELILFNAESFAIIEEAETLKPESEAFSRLGILLEKVLAAGLENLSPADFARFNKRLDEMKRWQSDFQPRLDSLMDRKAKHLAHEADLTRRLKKLGLFGAMLPANITNN